MEQVTSLYKAHFVLIYHLPFAFSISRYINGVVCYQKEFHELWSKNKFALRKRFFEDVYEVAFSFEALRFGAFHWDIRPPTIMFDQKDNRFVIIDWESVFDPFHSLRLNEIREAKFTLKDGTSKAHIQSYNKKSRYPYLSAGIYLFHHLVFECLKAFGATKTDEAWFSEYITNPLLSYKFDMESFKGKFDGPYGFGTVCV